MDKVLNRITQLIEQDHLYATSKASFLTLTPTIEKDKSHLSIQAKFEQLSLLMIYNKIFLQQQLKLLGELVVQYGIRASNPGM